MSIIVDSAPPNQLQWDFYKETHNKDSQVIHYYDEWAQEIWPDWAGLKTKTNKVPQGHWKDSQYQQEQAILINTGHYTQLRSDHPTTGVLYMSAIKDGKLEFLRYQYMMDLSYILDSWRQQFKSDSPVSDLSVQVQNIGVDTFMGDASLFLPGSRLDISVIFGKKELPMGIYWVDEFAFDQSKETVSISSRNYCGHWLVDQTMDELVKVEGKMHECIKQIFDHAGITNYVIQDGFTNINKYTFEPSDTIMQAIEKIINSARNPQPEFELVLLESHQGGLIFGRRNWADQYMANNYYRFNEGSDVFNRNTEKCLDGAYTRIMVTGDIKDTDPVKKHTPIFVNIDNFKYWYLKKHKTKHIESPTAMTTEEFKSFADAQAKAFQYVGVNEDFTGPYRPQLYVGDIAEVVLPDGVTGTSLGLINQITHNFSRDEGFTTDFIIDSGGIATEGESFVIYSATNKDHGRNRRMNIVDAIKILTTK